jgi:hypothetical protein
MEILHIQDIRAVFFYNKQQPHVDKRYAGIDFDQLEAYIRSGHKDCRHVTIVTLNNKRKRLNKKQARTLFRTGVVEF